MTILYPAASNRYIDTIFYKIYDGTFEAVEQLVGGGTVTETKPKEALVTDVSGIASWMTYGFPGTGKVYSLEKTQLETVTLDEAKAQAEELMAKLGMASYTVTADGIKVINLRDAYEQGEIVSTPAPLVDAQTVASALQGKINESRWPEEVKRITRATLTWMPVRADKGDGMVMTPVWVLSCVTEEYQPPFEAWAAFDAVNGTLIDAVFN